MNRDDAWAYALSQPGAWPDSPFGAGSQVAKVGDKIFLFLSRVDDQPAICVKNTAEAIEELKQRYPDAAGPAPYLDKRLWALLVIADVGADEVRELIEDSYDLVVAKLPKSRRPNSR